MKLLRGKHHYKSYQEMCKALEIEPAPRGTKRETQKQELQKTYRMTVQKNGSIDLERITKEQRAYEEKVKREQIKVIDGREVDLGSNLCYRDTYIDEYILYRALNASGRTDTKQGFLIFCFDRTKFFRELLRRDSLECADYSKESLHLVHDLVIDRLNAMVNTLLKRYEEKGYIQTEHFYELKNIGVAWVEDVQPSVDRALKELGLKSEYMAYKSKERRNEFIGLRDRYYKEESGKEIAGKRFCIEPLIELGSEAAEKEGITALTNKDIQIILTRFFDIFREKAIYDIDQELAQTWETHKIGSPARARKRSLREHEDEVKEIIRTYCAYMNTPFQGPQQAFYSIEELEDYYGSNADFSTALSHGPIDQEDLRKFEEGDTLAWYDEVNRNGKDEYDYYALSNMTEIDLQAKAAQKKEQDERLAKFIQHMQEEQEEAEDDEEDLSLPF